MKKKGFFVLAVAFIVALALAQHHQALKKYLVSFGIIDTPQGIPVQKNLERASSNGFSTVPRKASDALVTEPSKNSKDIVKETSDEIPREPEELMQELERIRQEIIAGKKPPAEEVSVLLVQAHRIVGDSASQEADIFLTPVYHLLHKNFSEYRELIFSTLSDYSMPGGLRYAMLQIVGHHWEDPESRQAVLAVFDNPVEEPPYMLGKSAEVLARYKVDIGDKIVERFPAAPEHAQFFYATALAALDRKEAVPMLSAIATADSDEKGFPVRMSVLRALAKMDIESEETADILTSTIGRYGNKEVLQKADDSKKSIENESLAMQTIQLLAKSSDPAVYNTILGFAKNEKLSVHVRVSAVEALGVTHSLPKNEKIQDLKQLKKQVLSSKSLSQSEKGVIVIMIDSVLGN